MASAAYLPEDGGGRSVVEDQSEHGRLGIGLVGSADIIIASTKARFGLPEVDNGALGCASHLARLVPPLKLRQMTLTCIPVSAQELFEYGSVFKLTEPDALRDEARALAHHIAARSSSAHLALGPSCALQR